MTNTTKIYDQKLPTVALIGRVNVGKSTLFNKLTENDKALISTIAGTTRTRNIGTVNWRGKHFRLIDTGGLTFSDDVILEDEIIEQTNKALKEADLILFVVDIKDGILPQEKELAKMINDKKDMVLFIANKADSIKWINLAHNPEFMKLGLGSPYPVSAANGANLGELLETIIKRLNKLPIRPKKLKDLNPIKVALIGKPNVGKSTLFNSLIGRDEVVVSDMAHTTREPFDTLIEYGNEKILFIDTAGIRRKTKVKGELERGGIAKSIKAIMKSDVVLLLLDAKEPLSCQDQQLGGLLREHSRSVIILVNKWDTAEANDDHFRNQTRQMIYGSFPHLKFSPILFISAKTKYRVHQIFGEINKAFAGRHIEITNNALDRFLNKITKEHLPSRGKGINHPKLLSLVQLRTDPPIFSVTVKAKTSLHPSYLKYIVNKLRDKFGFYATPIVIKVKKQKK